MRGRLDALSPFTQLLAIRPLLACAALLVAGVALLLTRRHRSAAAACAVAVSAAVLALAQIAPRAVDGADSGPTALTVLTANTLHSRVQPSVIVDLVARSGADVVALPETNRSRAASYARALSADRGERWTAFGDGQTGPDNGSPRPTSIVARAALEPVASPPVTVAPDAHAQVRVNLGRFATRANPAGLTVVAVHPLPPAPAASQTGWRRDLLALRPLCGDDDHLLAGDFNATIDHSPMRALKDAGCADAASGTGSGLKATWSGGPHGLVRPVIDHILTTGPWRATASGVLRLPGSDHRAVWARITLGR